MNLLHKFNKLYFLNHLYFEITRKRCEVIKNLKFLIDISQEAIFIFMFPKHPVNIRPGKISSAVSTRKTSKE